MTIFPIKHTVLNASQELVTSEAIVRPEPHLLHFYFQTFSNKVVHVIKWDLWNQIHSRHIFSYNFSYISRLCTVPILMQTQSLMLMSNFCTDLVLDSPTKDLCTEEKSVFWYFECEVCKAPKTLSLVHEIFRCFCHYQRRYKKDGQQ